MKRFLIPVVLIALVSWGVFTFTILTVPPKIDNELIVINIVYFLVSGWIATTTTISIAFYFINFLFEETPTKRLELEENLRLRRVFRTSLRRGAIFATALLSLGLLKIYGLDNLLNSAFVVGIALLIEVYFSSR